MLGRMVLKPQINIRINKQTYYNKKDRLLQMDLQMHKKHNILYQKIDKKEIEILLEKLDKELYKELELFNNFQEEINYEKYIFFLK